MPIHRFLFFTFKNSTGQVLNLRQRFGSCRRIQSSSHTKSTRGSHGKPNGYPIMPAETKTSRSYVIPVAVLGFAGLAAFVHYNDERRAVPKGQGNIRDRVNVKGPAIGGPFALTDTENRVVTEQDLLGNWVVLYFGYTSSPDVGPEQLQVMANAIKALELKENIKVLPLFVTIDPQRDTRAHLRAYLKEFDSSIVGLTGAVSAVRQMAQEYRVPFKKVYEEGDDYLVESSHCMYLISPSMEVIRCFGIEYKAEDLSEAIVKEVRRTS